MRAILEGQAFGSWNPCPATKELPGTCKEIEFPPFSRACQQGCVVPLAIAVSESAASPVEPNDFAGSGEGIFVLRFPVAHWHFCAIASEHVEAFVTFIARFYDISY